MLDPIEDSDLLEDFLPNAKTSIFGNFSAETLIESGCTVLLAETEEEGPVAALFLSDQPGGECSDQQGRSS